MNTREIGNKYEDKSVEILIKNTYKILERNYQNKFGEIDIIGQISLAMAMKLWIEKNYLKLLN